MQKHNKIKSPTKVAFIAALIIIVGGFFLLYDYIESKKVLAYDYISHYYYNGKIIIETDTRQIWMDNFWGLLYTCISIYLLSFY